MEWFKLRQRHFWLHLLQAQQLPCTIGEWFVLLQNNDRVQHGGHVHQETSGGRCNVHVVHVRLHLAIQADNDHSARENGQLNYANWNEVGAKSYLESAYHGHHARHTDCPL